MRILLIHNFYQKAGGEDVVYQAEGELLEKYGHQISRLAFDNSSLRSFLDVLKFGINLFYNYKSAKILNDRILSFKPDIIHVHNFFPIASPSIFYEANKHNIPIVVTLHNYRLICPSGILYHNNQIYEKSIHKTFPLDAIWKGVYRKSRFQTAAVVMMTGIHKLLHTWDSKIDAYITLSEFSRQLFVNSSLHVKPEKFYLKPNFTFDRGFDSNKENYFLFVGRLVPEKGVMTILKAFSQTKHHLKIIGAGDLESEVIEASRKYENIEFLGFQKNSEVIEITKKAKGLLFASAWYETFGLTVIEAFSAATPVIIANMGGHGQLVQHDYNGLHFEPNNVEDLIQQLQKLDDKNFVDVLATNARRTFLEKFTPEKNYEMLMDIYQKVLAKKYAIKPA
ncbi:MAG: glycosyltransferase family 4 protein [Microscillaceae bacterium]|jgi:glycosyltransferase involved in cell wall biosynthesis|nr:glycosyltransferase family 4 protein [Microscillaceae bacterium]